MPIQDTIRKGGIRVDLYPEMSQETAQARTNLYYQQQGTRNDQRAKLQPAWGQLIGSGWGQMLYQRIKEAGGVGDDTLTEPIYPGGRDPNTNDSIFLVPVSRSFQRGMTNVPVYREIHVGEDAESLAQEAAEKAALQQKLDLDKKKAELERLRSLNTGGGSTIDIDLAIERAKQGQGEQAIEITVWDNGEKVTVALDAAESAAGDGPHPGESILQPGAWEMKFGAVSASSKGLPRKVLSRQQDGTVTAGVEEVTSLIAVARGAGTAGRVKMAQDALNYAKISY